MDLNAAILLSRITAGGPGSGPHPGMGKVAEKYGYVHDPHVSSTTENIYRHPEGHRVAVTQNAWMHRYKAFNPKDSSGQTEKSLETKLKKWHGEK